MSTGKGSYPPHTPNPPSAPQQMETQPQLIHLQFTLHLRFRHTTEMGAEIFWEPED